MFIIISYFSELTYLRLVKLDVSCNRISVLPNELRKMKSLIELKLAENPLTSPPASVRNEELTFFLFHFLFTLTFLVFFFL